MNSPKLNRFRGSGLGVRDLEFVSRFPIYQSGFTLIEIMIAIAILAVSIVSFYAAQGNSLRASGRAEQIQKASLLARQVITQKMLELDKEMEKGTFPEEKEENGQMDPPYEDYRWEMKIRKIEIPVASLPSPEEMTGNKEEGTEVGKNSLQAPESAKESMAQTVTKKINESIREVQVKIIWEELGEEQSLVVTTHLAKL